jgi:hypothetical protein
LKLSTGLFFHFRLIQRRLDWENFAPLACIFTICLLPIELDSPRRSFRKLGGRAFSIRLEAMSMSTLHDLYQWLLSTISSWWALPLAEQVEEAIKLVLQVAGSWEFVRLFHERLFKRRAKLEKRLKWLEEERIENQKEIAELTDKLKAETLRLPETAIAKAEREWRDHNEDSAIRELEIWFKANAESISSIALHIAKFHISRAIPDPTGHLDTASNMLRLVRGASPNNEEAKELWRELDIVNASLQEQLILGDGTQIAWNKEMSQRLHEKGEALVPIIQTLGSVAQFFFNEGQISLAPLFADRAATLAMSGGRPLRTLWFTAETNAAAYHARAGRASEALRRIDRAIIEGQAFLDSRDLSLLKARYSRALVLVQQGRPGDALAEIDAFGPIEAEVRGARNPHVLETRWLHAEALAQLGRYGDALAEIDAFGPIQAEVMGARHPNVLATRYLHAKALVDLGRYGEALAEINAFSPIQAEVLSARQPDVLATRWLRAQVLGRLGRYGESLAEINAFAPIQIEVLGARHPHVLTTRSLRAQALDNLGRYGEALAEVDALGAIRVEVLGARDRDVLANRRLRARVLSHLSRHGEALAEINAFSPIQVEVTDARHPDVLTTRYLRAQVLDNLGRYGDALAEIDAFGPIGAEVKGAHHPDVLTTRFLRAIVISHLGRYADALAEIDAFMSEYVEALGSRHPFGLTAKSIRAECLANLGRWDDAISEMSAIDGSQEETSGLPPDLRTLILKSLRTGIEIASNRNVNCEAELGKTIRAIAIIAGKDAMETLWARYRLGRLLLESGRAKKAKAEIADVIARFDPLLDPGHILVRGTKALLGLTEGQPFDGKLPV